ncbi:MAG: hypothetical protein KJO40_13670 [Deltaproteobacteria bacterium]|nr:hypothetical protein [Deltaproteobacteria bacterium]
MSAVAVALGGFAVIALQIAFTWWLVRWGRNDERELRRQQSRIDELDRAVEDRDIALAGAQAALGREKAALSAAEKQCASAIKLVEKMATDNPRAVTTAIREQLARLQALSQVRDTPAGEGG